MKYELHITVAPDQRQAAIEFAERYGGGRLQVHAFRNLGRGGFCSFDVMTSELADGSYSRAVVSLERRVEVMRREGLTVLRAKIEREPWKADAETPLYYETHVKVVGSPLFTGHFPGLLVSVSEPRKNWTVTLRTRDELKAHMRRTHEAVTQLTRAGIAVVGAPRVEACLHDDNQSHDAAWEEASL